MAVIPPVRTIYWDIETAKLERFKKLVKARDEKLRRQLGEVRETAREVRQTARELGESAVEAGRSVKEKLHGI